ncbi:4456_t:CDS:2 [Paraglomus brasilianum]|uniref:protein-disulfide reductase n=1 Tax=Paraglomus brasilianum TaxID=144538 RepID=A0A9N9F0Y9_9GLOM|nr:4456_t:CDS:2 [Paraglomus brasilianum]
MSAEENITRNPPADCTDDTCPINFTSQPTLDADKKDCANDPILSRITLYDCNGNKVPTSEVENKIIGFYVGASWCPPCRLFAPRLCAFLEDNRSSFAVIHVSLDHSESAFEEYTYAKPWYNIPYDLPIRESLVREWKVSTIPALLIYNPMTHQTITTWGRTAVMKNPQGCLEEWKQNRHGVGWIQLIRGNEIAVLIWVGLIYFCAYYIYQLFVL